MLKLDEDPAGELSIVGVKLELFIRRHLARAFWNHTYKETGFF